MPLRTCKRFIVYFVNIKNVEIKARCKDPDRIRSILKELNAEYKGLDHQVDTYFHVNEGRLKLRQGNIENNLIYYRRPDSNEPKRSDVRMVPLNASSGSIQTLLAEALGIMVTVNKQREIFFIDNVKFHIDRVKVLGSFVEIEAIDRDGTFTEEQLDSQCRYYMKLLDINREELVSRSYSDLLIASG